MLPAALLFLQPFKGKSVGDGCSVGVALFQRVQPLG